MGPGHASCRRIDDVHLGRSGWHDRSDRTWLGARRDGGCCARRAATVLAACQTTGSGLPPRAAAAQRGAPPPPPAGGDWLAWVRDEHRALDATFARMLEARDTAERARLRDALAGALIRHAMQEESAVYPVIALSGRQAEAQQLFVDHAQAKVLLAELDLLPEDHPAWAARVANLRAIVMRHAQEEEGTVFPALQRSMSAEQNAGVASRWQREAARFVTR